VPLFENESVQNLSYENKFDLHENEPVGGTGVLQLDITRLEANLMVTLRFI